jgi:hydroxymethylglutaryl-CoA lyase
MPTVTTPPVKIIECPRDAWQAMPQQIPPRSRPITCALWPHAGFQHIDAVSFVSPRRCRKWPIRSGFWPCSIRTREVEIIAIVVNEQGAERAIRTGAVRTLGFPYSISATFLERNQRQTLEQARQTLKKYARGFAQAGLGVVAYLSMAFGNPYGDPWRQEDVIAACLTLKELGIKQISLADTVGMASPGQIRSLLSAVLAEVPGIELGAHLHARPEQAALKVAAAYQAGCRRLDMALGGQGGCPFAQDALVGNVATEAALAELSKLGANLPRLRPLDELLAMGRAIADRFGAAKAMLNPLRSNREHEKVAINYATLEIKEAAGIHTITMNRPERRNALNPQMIAELTHALGESATCSCGVVVLTGAGTAFCSGMDLENLKSLSDQRPEDQRADAEATMWMMRRLVRTD